MSSLLSSPSSLLTGAILAGGHSSRFGSNKALFAPNGETLISKAAGLLRSVAREVLVSASLAWKSWWTSILTAVQWVDWRRSSSVVLRHGCLFSHATCHLWTKRHLLRWSAALTESLITLSIKEITPTLSLGNAVTEASHPFLYL